MKLELLEALAEKATKGPLNERIVGLAMLGEFTVKHTYEIINLVKAAKEHLSNDTGATHMMLLEALAAFEEKK